MTTSSSKTDLLLKTFFTVCEKHLRFLETKHGLTYISGLAEYRNRYEIVRPYYQQEVEKNFIAVTRYEKEGLTIEILYRGQDLEVETTLYYNGVLRFSIEEVLSAARKFHFVSHKPRALTTPEGLTTEITALEKTLQKYGKILFSPTPKVLERAQTIRVKHMEQAIRRYYAETMQEASTLAARAYIEKDYRTVITLLEPHRAHLSSGDIKKLDLAKKHLLS